MTPVTDPKILAQLNAPPLPPGFVPLTADNAPPLVTDITGGANSPPRPNMTPVTDPQILAQLNTPPLPDGFVPLQPAPGIGTRAKRGLMDVGQGIKQLYLMATDPNAAKQYTAQVNAEIAQYEQARQAAGETGIDWWRLGGAAAPGILLAPFTGGESIPATLAAGAGLGAASAASEFSPEGTFSAKAIQAGTGAIGGAAGGALAAGVSRAVAPLVSRATSAVRGLYAQSTGQATDDAAKAAVSSQLGAEFNTLPAAQQDSLIAAAKQAAGSGRTFDAAAAQRANDIQAVGATPTAGAVTRDPAQWYFEQETSKLRGPGDQLQQTFVNNNRALMDAVPGMRPPNASATSGYEAAESARQAVQGFAKGSQQDVGAMYDAARNAAGAGTEVPMQPIADRLGKVVEDYGVENLPSAVVTRAKEYGLLNGTQTRSFTVSDAEQFRRFLGNNINPANAAQTAAVKQLQGAVDDAVSSLPPADAEAGQAFQAARQAARNRFAALEPTPVAALNGTNEAPVNFIETKVLGAKPGELAGLRDVVTKQDPAAWDNVRSTVVDWLQQKATLGDAEGNFSGKRFGDALDKIGNARLKVLFSPDELAQLGTIRRASYALTREPPYANVNHSNSASTLSNLASGAIAGAGHLVSDIPLIGPVAAGLYRTGKDAIANTALSQRAAAAVNPGAAAFTAAPFPTVNARQILARYLLAIAPPTGLDATGAALGTGPR